MNARRLAAVVLLLSACSGCRERRQPGSPSARPDIVESLRADLAAERDPADGGGRAWLEQETGEPAAVEAGGEGRWRLVYEAGPLGIAEGGMLFLETSPFWGWSTPQVEDPAALGFTTVETEARGLTLEAQTLAENLLGVAVRGRALAPGERVTLVYGAGERGARADRYAERRERLWLAVDGDGDGVRSLLADSPAVDVQPGPPRRAILTLPSIGRPGEPAELQVALVDGLGNAGHPFVREVELVVRALPCDVELSDLACDPEARLELPASVVFTAPDGGRRTVPFTVPQRGVFLVDAQGPEGLEGRSNPLVVSSTLPLLYWGDLHGHSQLSDGTGTPEDYFRYARDVAGLDVIALTDHDHWGVRPLALTPEFWGEIREQVLRFHQPGRFVTLLGYEWTSWIYGHRHVLYFGEEGRVLSSVDPAYETPQQLWAALRGEPALTFAHHSAGGPVATDWTVPPDPVLEPVTEVVSVHGMSEAADAAAVIYDAVPGNFVRDALDRGYVLGFVGSGDSHDGHPGLAGLNAPTGGLAGIWAAELTREGVLEALRARRVYATSGPRILLSATLDDEPAGSTVTPRDTAELEALVVAPEILAGIDLVRSSRLVESTPLATRVHAQRWTLRDLERGEYLYLRAVQRDGGTAWSSPFFVR